MPLNTLKKFNLNKEVGRAMFDFSTQEVERDIKKALEIDAKEMNVGYKIEAYQLIVWGDKIFDQNENIAKSINELNVKMEAKWAILNIIDLESKQSHVFVNLEGQEAVSQALDVKFKDSWAILPAILRKQIMPQVSQVLNK